MDQESPREWTHDEAMINGKGKTIYELATRFSQGQLTEKDYYTLINVEPKKQPAKPSAAEKSDSSTFVQAVQVLNHTHEYRLFPWKKERDTCLAEYDEEYEAATRPNMLEEMRNAFVQRVESKTPLSKDLVMILSMLLYSTSPHPHLILADVLLHKGFEERLKMHNWTIYRDAKTPQTMKNKIGETIASGKLVFPLFYGDDLVEYNRTIIKEAVEAKARDMEGGGPASNGKNSKQRHNAYEMSVTFFNDKPDTQKVMAGGEPNIAVLDARNQQIGYWDGKDVQSMFNEMSNQVQSLRAELKRLQSNTQTQARGSRGGSYAARGRAGGRGQGRGGRGGRGGYRMYGGDDYDEDDMQTPAHNEDTKN